MKDFLWGMALVATLAGMLVLGVRADTARRDATAAEQKASVWQARFAEEASKAQPVAETVRVRVASVRTLRDSLLVNLTDTVLVQQFIYRTDTLRVACLACAARLDSLRFTADTALASKDSVIRELRPSRWAKYKAPAAFVSGLVLGAFVRGGGR